MNDRTSNNAWKWSLIGLFGVAALALAAGGYWLYPTLSEVAKSLELAAKAQDLGGAAAALAEVKEVCAAVQTGWTGDTAEAGRS